MRTAHKLIVDNDDMTDVIELRGDLRGKTMRSDVMGEICLHLAPYRADGRPIAGDTVISKDLTIDSLAVMDMVMELEDRFDVTIPMNVVAEIHTVDELADTILDLRAQR